MQIRLLKMFCISTCILLVACDSTHHSIQDSGLDEQVVVEEHTEPAEGRRLTDVAGRTAVPNTSVPKQHSTIKNGLSEKAQAYVGRYHVILDCSEKFVLCENGKVEFVNSLLADGTSHRTLLYLGKMSYDKDDGVSNRIYQRNTWTYNPKTNQIEVKRAGGINFYYNVTAEGNLAVDLEKVRANNAIENGQFIDGSYVPTQEYVLKRLDN